jgi:CheY-like chemotaxis protein
VEFAMKQLEVIVVDDQPDLAETTGRFLRLYGHHVSVFNSGPAVLEALDHITPHLILSDINMPEMNGCELAIRIKQHPGCEHVILAAISGFEDEAHRQATIDAGFDYRFVKPLSPLVLQDFVQKIADHLN